MLCGCGRICSVTTSQRFNSVLVEVKLDRPMLAWTGKNRCKYKKLVVSLQSGFPPILTWDIHPLTLLCQPKSMMLLPSPFRTGRGVNTCQFPDRLVHGDIGKRFAENPIVDCPRS